MPSVLSSPPQNIIVRMPNWLGDLVMATPILKHLRHHWPQAKITALCQGALSSVLQEDPHINRCISFKRPKSVWPPKMQKELTELLSQEEYDLSILLTNSFSSAYWFWQAGIPNRVGYATHWRSWLLNYPVTFPAMRTTQHLVRTYKMLLEPLGLPISNTDPALYVTQLEQQTVQEQLRHLGIEKEHLIIGVNPGAAYGSAKCWLPERFKEVTSLLLQNPKIRVIFFGDQAGASLVGEICQGFSERVFNLAGKTKLRELMAYIQACHLFLTNDSGPMHMASALGVPLLALFGSTSDVATGPYRGGKVIHKHVPCSPCYRRECPIDFRCMRRIEVDEVYQELQHLLLQPT